MAIQKLNRHSKNVRAKYIMDKLTRKEREFNTRRMEILEQAEKIFAVKGFHNVTVAEIANASGFSIGSLYQFFEGKENLYNTMITEKLDLMYGQIKEKVKAAQEITDKITMLIEAHFQFVEENTDFCRIFLRGEIAPLSEMMTSLRQKIMDDHLQYLIFIENILKSGIKTGYLRPLNHRAMAAALFSLIRTSAIDWMLLPEKESLSSKKDFIMDIFLKGVVKYEK
jgi:AcrR family transcriptional regulator